jgi:hypothetical protein
LNRTWVHLLLLGTDAFGAIVIFGKIGITISSLCKIAMAGQDAPLKLWGWQCSLLLWLGARLGHAHCDGAALADIARAEAVIGYLTAK